MSTILDALKRVEEQLRNEAGRKASDGLTSDLDTSNVSDDSPIQPRETFSGEDDEAMRVYLSLVDMIGRIQEHVRTTLEEERAASRTRLAETTHALSALQDDLALQRKTLREELLQRDTAREAGNVALAATQSRIGPLAEGQAKLGDAIAELSKTVAQLRKELEGQCAALRGESGQRDAEREAKAVVLAEAESQTHAETREMVAELTRALTGMRTELADLRTLLQNEVRQRDTEREDGKAALATAESQAHAETQEAVAELTRALAALRTELAGQHEWNLSESQRRDAEREAGKAALAAAQSELEPVTRALVETRENLTRVVQAVGTLQKDSTRRHEVHKREIQQRDSERDDAKAGLAAAESRIEVLSHTLAETTGGVAKLVEALEAQQQELGRHGEGLQQEQRKRKKEREDSKAALAAAHSQIEPLKVAHAEAAKVAGELSRSHAALHDDLARLREAFQQEIQRRDAEREASKGALAAIHTQLDALRELLAERDAAVIRAQEEATSPVAAGSDTRDQGAWQKAEHALTHDPSESKPALDKDEAQRLHGAAGEAYIKGHFEEALHLLDIIDAAFPDNKSILYNRAECLISLGRKDEARTLCDYLITELEYPRAGDLKKLIED